MVLISVWHLLAKNLVAIRHIQTYTETGQSDHVT